MGDVESLEEFFAEGRNLLTGGVGIVPSRIGLLGEGGLLLRGHGVAGRLEFLVEILQLLARVGLVLGQVEAPSCRDPLEFVGAEGELEEDIDAGPRVVGQVGLRLPVVVEILGTETDRGIVGGALGDPVAVPHLPAPVRLGLAQVGPLAPGGHGAVDQLDGLVRLDEELQFHLLELPGAEGEVLRRDLVAEGLADLADPEGDLHARGVADILELGEDRLGRLGTQVSDIVLRGGRADIGAEHEVEGTRLVEQSPRLRVEIDGALDDLGPFLAQQFDLLGLTSRCAGVLGNQETHPLAEALDVLSLFHQHREGAIKAPSVGSLGSREADH